MITYSVWDDETVGDDVAERGIWIQSAVTAAADVNGQLKIRIYGAMGSGQWAKSTPHAMFDDVTLTLVPEPATAALALFGLCGLMLRRRR